MLKEAHREMSSPKPAAHESNHHYNQKSSSFELFLDEHMKYSSGLFLKEDDTLTQAQENKMHYIAEQLQLKPGDRILDIGCGWGSLTLFLATHYPVQVTGITPAPAQMAYILSKAERLGISEKIQVINNTAEAVELPSSSFNAVTMLGSITHMKDKKSIISNAYKMLKRRGRLYLSESCFKNKAIYDEFDKRAGTEFIRREIFGWGELIPFSEYIRFAEDAGFSLCSIIDLTKDYYKTIEHWKKNAIQNAAKIESIETGKTGQLLRYFDLANAGWGYTTKHYGMTAIKQR